MEAARLAAFVSARLVLDPALARSGWSLVSLATVNTKARHHA